MKKCVRQRTFTALISAALLSACSSTPHEAQNADSDQREPAAAGVPYAGKPPTTHAGPTGGTPSYPGGPVNPSAPPAPKEAVASCNIRFDQLPMGSVSYNGYIYNYSLADVLMPKSWVPTWNGYVESITGNLEYDRQLLGYWFRGNISPGSEIYEAARSSPALFQSLQFINGNSESQPGMPMVWQDYYVGARMARIIAALTATDNDPNCSDYIRKFADRSLGQYARELDGIPFRDTVRYVKDGTIGDKFHQLSESRSQMKEQISNLNGEIASKEEERKESLEQSKIEIQEHFHELKAELVKMEPCSSVVNFKTLTASDATSEEAHLHDIVNACREKLQAELGKYRSRELRLLSEASHVKNAKEKLQARVDGDPSQLERLEEKEKKINEDLASIQEKTATLNSYMEVVNKPEGEVHQTMKEIENEVAARRKLANGYSGPELKQVKEVQERLKATDSPWLSEGIIGQQF